jgi:hypothetical protein
MKRASDLKEESKLSKHDSHLGAVESAECGSNSEAQRQNRLDKLKSINRTAIRERDGAFESMDDALIWPAGVADKEFLRRWLKQTDSLM